MPKRGAVRQVIRDVRVERAGKHWTASWHVEDGELLVWSAWGSRKEPVDKTADLNARAQKLLGEIVDHRPSA